MPVSITMPQLGESVTEGTVTRWLKNVGDTVAMDEPLLEVSTDKVDTEIPSPTAGVLLEIRAVEDEVVKVGGELAVIGEVAEATATPAAPAPVPPVVPQTPNITVDNSAAVLTAAMTAYASPIARKLARESGVDIATVAPSAPDGRISKQDIRDAAATAGGPPATAAPPAATPAPPVTRPSRPDSPERGRTEPMTRLRRVIAERMVDSLHVSAQLTTVVEVDVTRIAALRTRAKEAFLAREGISLSFLPFFARATLEALKQYPNVNASVDSDAHTVTYHDSTHLGIAVDTDRGLLVPVVRDAGDLTLSGLARRIADLAERTRTSKVGPDELSGGTFTLTNTGSRGALFDTPIINQPQVGILGTGAVVKRPIVVSEPHGEDAIAIRSMVYFALTYDHRIVDGANAARFLGAIKARLESADFEAELGL